MTQNKAQINPVDHRDNPNRVIREKERFALTAVPRSQWWRMEVAGEAPKRIKLSKTANGIAHGWPYGEIIDWIEARKAARKPGAQPERLARGQKAAADRKDGAQ